MDMFDDLFTEEDFSLEDEKEEEPELEMETAELDEDEEFSNPVLLDCDDEDCDSDCDHCNSAWDTGHRNWDTGEGMRPVPKNVWKPKSWKTF